MSRRSPGFSQSMCGSCKAPSCRYCFAPLRTHRQWCCLVFWHSGLEFHSCSPEAFQQGHDRRLLLIDGIGVCLAGVIVAVVPTLTLPHLIRIIAFWAFFAAICEVLIARTIRRHLPDEWFLAMAGAGSLAFGAFLLQDREISDSFLLAWPGSYALFSAMTMSGLAFRF